MLVSFVQGAKFGECKYLFYYPDFSVNRSGSRVCTFKEVSLEILERAAKMWLWCAQRHKMYIDFLF